MRECIRDQGPGTLCSHVEPRECEIVHQDLLQPSVLERVGIDPGTPDGDVQPDDDVGHSFGSYEALETIATVGTIREPHDRVGVHCSRFWALRSEKLRSERSRRRSEEA